MSWAAGTTRPPGQGRPRPAAFKPDPAPTPTQGSKPDYGRWIRTKLGSFIYYVLWQNGRRTEAYFTKLEDGTYRVYSGGMPPTEYKTMAAAKRATLTRFNVKPAAKGPPCPPDIPYGEVRRPSKTVLCTDDGKRRKLKKIGGGAFSEVYVEVDRHVPGDRVWSFSSSHESADKDAMADSYYYATKRAKKHLPAIMREGVTSGGYAVFSMPKYGTELEAGTRAAQQARELRKALERGLASLGGRFVAKTGYERNYATLTELEALPAAKVPPALKEAVETIVSTAADYGASMTFEFPRRNLATDKKGNLILLDPIFDMEAMNRKTRVVRRW